MTSTRPLGAVVEIALGKMRTPGSDDGDGLRPYLRAANVGDGVLLLDDVKRMRFTESEYERFRLRPGDVLLTEASVSREQVGQTAVYQGDPQGVAMQNTLIRLRPRQDINPRYLYWWSRHAHSSRLYATAAQGLAIWHLSAERLRRLPIPVLPVEEQRRIAGFLDEQVALLDRAVQLRQRQIDLLAERFQARIDEVGEGRLGGSSNAPTLVRASLLLRVLPGYAFPSTQFSHDDGVRLLRGTNVGVRAIDWRDTVRWEQDQEAVHKRFGLRPGDVVMGMDRPWIGAGFRIARLSEDDLPALLLQRVACLRPAERLHAGYMYWAYQVQRFRQEVEGELTGLSVPHLSADQIGSHQIPLPGLDTQRAIAAELDALEANATRASALLAQSSRLIQERKDALVTAAVTGQFDVTTARSVA